MVCAIIISVKKSEGTGSSAEAQNTCLFFCPPNSNTNSQTSTGTGSSTGGKGKLFFLLYSLALHQRTDDYVQDTHVTMLHVHAVSFIYTTKYYYIVFYIAHYLILKLLKALYIKTQITKKKKRSNIQNKTIHRYM